MSHYSDGVDDYIHFGKDCPCPHKPDSKEAKDWMQGFKDAGAWDQPDKEEN